MEHYIALIMSASDYCDACPKVFFKLCRENLPSGVMTTFAMGDKQASMKKTSNEGKTTLAVPLVRHLTEKEVFDFVEAFDPLVERDYKIAASRVDDVVEDEVTVEVDEGPLLELCTAWAKKQHDDWLRDKLDAGWRYGTEVSVKEKKHPLIRQWADLPAEYREVSTEQPEALIKLFNEQGYVLVAKTQLDQLLKP